MKEIESLLRFILGPVRGNTLPMVLAVQVAIELIFASNVPIYDILVTKDIYPEVASRLSKIYDTTVSLPAVSKQIERTSNLCWESMLERDLVKAIIGINLREIKAPRDMIFYLAFYCHLNKPYYVAVKNQSSLLF